MCKYAIEWLNSDAFLQFVGRKDDDADDQTDRKISLRKSLNRAAARTDFPRSMEIANIAAPDQLRDTRIIRDNLLINDPKYA